MKLSYLQQGFGAALPLVLLHPFPLNSHFWKNQLSGLSRDRHVIAPNFRGYGATVIEPSDRISIETFASDIRKTMRNLSVPRAVFAGCSMGGYVLFELWRQEPSLVAGMAFIDTRAEADTEEARQKRMDTIHKIQQAGTVDLPDSTANNLSPKTRKNAPTIERDVRAWAAEPCCETVVKSLEMLAKRPNSVPTLATINVPTVVIVGDEDKVTPPDAAKVIADNITESKLVTIPDAGHFSPLENPSAVNQAIREFLPTTS